MEFQTFMQQDRSKLASGILIVLYAVGIVGILTPLHPDFILLTPFNLLISVGLMLWAHQGWTNTFRYYLAACFVWGFGAELIGVQTGLIFGDYAYGKVLGPKLFGTPLMIGVNWVLVSYTGGVTINYFVPKLHWVVKGIMGSILLVGLDLLIEPVAISQGFWSWEGGFPPFQNYVGWFLVALPLQLVFARFFGNCRNIVALILFILQLCFFAILALAG